MERFDKTASRFHRWFTKAALPLWVETGYDHARGGFYEALDFKGHPVAEATRRVRVQARQIYVMSRATELGWHDEAPALADAGFQYFLDKACPNGGSNGCVHTLTPDGTIVDDTRDLYDQAFLLLACAWRWRAAKDERALTLADKTLNFLNSELVSPYGGWIENDRGDLPRRQNPHMHLLEAFMALFEATGDEHYLTEADKAFALFTDKFFNAENNTLREFFTESLQQAPGDKGAYIEPGHMVEWTSLLNTYGRLRNIDVSDYGKQLFQKARAAGTAPQSIFLIDSLQLDSTPGGKRRLWPQTEYLKACSVMAASGDQNAVSLVADIIEACFDTYFDQPVAGLWCDQFDANGNPCAQDVPASILYHLIDAVLAIDSMQKNATPR